MHKLRDVICLSLVSLVYKLSPMPRPRRETVSSTEPGVYYCHSGFTQGFEFMGNDPVARKFRGHRRQWVIDKCRKLAYRFAVEDHDPILGGIIKDLSLWFFEWLMKKDLPKRAIGAPALLAELAMKLGLKRLNLSWLGNGIYPGTENEKGRRARRNKSQLSRISARGEPKRDAPG